MDRSDKNLHSSLNDGSRNSTAPSSSAQAGRLGGLQFPDHRQVHAPNAYQVSAQHQYQPQNNYFAMHQPHYQQPVVSGAGPSSSQLGGSMPPQVLHSLITNHKNQIESMMKNGQVVPPHQLQQLQMLLMVAKEQNGQNGQNPGIPTHQPQSLVQDINENGKRPLSGERTQNDAHWQNVHERAKSMAYHGFQKLFATGKVASMSKSDQEILIKTLYQKALSSLTENEMHTQHTGSRAMRVAIDKRNRDAADRMFNAEDTTKADHADEVVRRCEEITKSLRSHLEKKGKKGDGGDVEYEQVTQQQLIEACGDNARYLKPYQIVGINFLMLLYRTNVGGAILADEMGLGKTAQLITYMGTIASLENDKGPHLVVVPASLLENWQRELQRWCPKMKSVVYYGKHRSIIRRRLNELRQKLENGETVDDDLADLQDPDLLADIAASEKLAMEANKNDDESDDDYDTEVDVDDSDEEYDTKNDRGDIGMSTKKRFVDLPPPNWDFSKSLSPAPFDVLLTSYTLFERNSRDQRKDREFLESWKWSHLIMDEAHALKNREAQRTTRLRRVANVSRRRIMMTGTPLQNDLFELQNLMHFLLPQIFESESFEDLVDMANNDEEAKNLTERMKQLLGPFVLRRLKTEVAGQLTKKKHTTEFIEMTEEQKALYDASLESMKSEMKVSDKVVSDNSDNGLEKFMRSIGAKKISHMFTHLRKIAQHPLLVRSNYEDSEVEIIAKKAVEHNLFSGNATLKKVTEELLGYSDFSLHAFCYGAGPDFAMHKLNDSHLMTSTKFRFLAELLPKLKESGSRPLIFSQWTAVLDIVEWLMEVLQLPYVRLDGSTAVDERLATVDKFNTSDEVFAFLLSTRAGGQGLNLTGADTVILHDVDFNPQIDRQAEDRCHRLGQTKPVMVYRLITKSTVDQNIYNLSLRKLKLDAAVLDGITTGKGAKLRQNAQERQQMGFILRSLFAGEEDYEQMEFGSDDNPQENGEREKVPSQETAPPKAEDI